MRALSIAAAIVLTLGACAAPPPVVIGCPAVKAWTGAEQLEIKAALAAVPAGSILGPMTLDYSRMRDEARACLAPARGAHMREEGGADAPPAPPPAKSSWLPF